MAHAAPLTLFACVCSLRVQTARGIKREQRHRVNSVLLAEIAVLEKQVLFGAMLACKRIWRVCSSVCTLPNHSKLVSSKTVRLSASPLRIRYGGRLRAIRWRMWDVGLILAGLLHQTNSYDDQIATVRLLEKLDFTRSDEGVLKRIMENVKLPPCTPMSHRSCRTVWHVLMFLLPFCASLMSAHSGSRRQHG